MVVAFSSLCKKFAYLTLRCFAKAVGNILCSCSQNQKEMKSFGPNMVTVAYFSTADTILPYSTKNIPTSIYKIFPGQILIKSLYNERNTNVV